MQSELARTIPLIPLVALYALYLACAGGLFVWHGRRMAVNAAAQQAAAQGDADFELELSIAFGRALLVAVLPIVLVFAVAALRN